MKMMMLESLNICGMLFQTFAYAKKLWLFLTQKDKYLFRGFLKKSNSCIKKI